MSSELKAIKRDRVGSRAARALRADGRIPASIQGQEKDNLDVSLEAASFLAARRHHESLFDIEVAGGAVETAMVREIQYDAFGDNVIHVEFRRVVRGVAIETEVELRFVGMSRGGVLTPLHRTITILAIPSKIPDAIEVDATVFSEGQTVLASDIKLPDGVELAMAADEHMAVVAGAAGAEASPEDAEDGEAEAETEA